MKTAFIIIIIHWIADFLCQTDWQAKNKSTNFNALVAHTSIYALIWLIPAIIMLEVNAAIIYVLIAFLSHTLIDYFTSRLNTYLWSKGKTHYFFVSIGFDQILHYGQLFLTYYLLV